MKNKNMNTYYAILQINCGFNTVVYPSKVNDYISNQKFIDNINKERRNSLASRVYFFIQNLSCTKNLKEFTIMKITKIHRILSSTFLKENNEVFLQKLFNTQRHYYAFSKLAQIIRYKKTSQIKQDLFLNPFTEKMQTLKIIHRKIMYEFSIRDLINIINTSLSHCILFFAEPQYIKNPYDNIRFSYAVLYNIYFAIQQSSYIMPALYHQFFLCDFNLHRFKMENEYLIRDTHIKKVIYTTEETSLFRSMKNMLKIYSNENLIVNNKINKPEFIQIMRPYYYLYLTANYNVQGIEKTSRASYVFQNKINELYEYNYKFGRVLFIREPITRKFKYIYDLDHPKFTMNDAYKY